MPLWIFPPVFSELQHLLSDKILREYYAAEGSKVRYRLNQRSAESCRGRAAALGLTYSGANRKWSSSEDEILRNYYPTEGAEEEMFLDISIFDAWILQLFAVLPALGQEKTYTTETGYEYVVHSGISM